MAKPDCIVSSDGDNLTTETESTESSSFLVTWERGSKKLQLTADKLRGSASSYVAHWFNIRNGLRRKA